MASILGHGNPWTRATVASYDLDGRDGNLYRTDKSGGWQVVNSGGEYKNTVAMVALDGELWTIELDGNLYTTPAM